ncbi:MAG: hypothetical protein OQK07_12050, partial [Rhodospirillales bacterium]|nr:hypothetical protein [Rhodospirillales bacterium]
MIITRTPFRISFFGGGTDYPTWVEEHGGATLSTTINRYCYIFCRHLPPFFKDKNRIVWSEIELVNDPMEIRHPVIGKVLSWMDIKEGIEIHHTGDLPARSGLGSSSSFTVGLLNSLHTLKEKVVSKETLAKQAIWVEQDLLKENVGCQDQIAAAYGGLNKLEFSPGGRFDVKPVPLSQNRLQSLESHLMLFYTGVSRRASQIAGEVIKSIPNKTADLHRMREMVDEGVDILTSNADIADFGRLLHESWMLKRGLAPSIAPSFIDEIYETARGAGALGGKLLGAGGGGFILMFAPPSKREAVCNALSKLLLVPIEIEFSGSQVVFYQPGFYTRTALTTREFFLGEE